MNFLDSKVNLAIEESQKSDHKQKIGVIIFNKKIIISKGHNTSLKSVKKLHPKFQRWKGSVHAEVDAIIKAKTDLKGCEMLIVRINSGKQFRLSKPCLYCMSYIEHVGIKRIFYTIPEYPYIIEEKI